MTSKHFLRLLLAIMLLSTQTQAQTAPGWNWTRTLNDNTYPSQAGNENRTASVGRDATGNLYVAGAFVGNLTIGPPPTSGPNTDSDVFLAKYGPTGNLLWVRTMRSPTADEASELVVTPSGRCTIAGTYGGTGGLSFASFGSSLVLPDAAQVAPGCGSLPFVAAINPDGSLAWATCPSSSCLISSAYPVSPYGRNLATDGQDNVYWSVTARASMVINGVTYPQQGITDAALLKLNAGGQVQWVRRAGAVGAQVSGAALQADQTGNVYWHVRNDRPFTFDNTTIGTNSYTTLIKLATATNQVQWVRSNLLQVGSYAYAGEELVGIDSAAGVLYLSYYTWGQDIIFNGPGSPLVVPKGSHDATFVLVQCDLLSGQVRWVKPLAYNTIGNGGGGMNALVYPAGTGLVVLTNTIVAGITSFVGSPTIFSAAQGGLVCVLQYSLATGQTEWVRTAGSDTGNLYANSQAGTYATNAVVDPTSNVYVAGLYYGPAHFGSTALPATNGAYHTFLAKLDQTVLATKAAVATGKAWQPYPNPATGTVHLGGLPPQAQVHLLDALGRPVRQTTSADLSLSGLAPGLYLLQVINTPDPYQSQRLTVE